MRILALNFNQKGVGTYRRSFYFSRELARCGHDVTLATVSGSSRFRTRVCWKHDWIGELSEPRGDGPCIRLIEGPAWGYRALPGWGSGPLDIWGRIRELETGNYDTVLGFEYHPNVSLPVYLMRNRKRFRFVSDWCDWFGGSSNHLRGWQLAHRIDSHLEEKIRRVADRVSVTSRLLFERAVSIGVPAHKITHIPEGAATDYIVPMEQSRAREEASLPLEVPLIVAVRNGDMCREVTIFAELLRRVPKALFLIVGSVSPRALELAERIGVLRQIISTGWVSDEAYPRYLGCADVCICPLEASRNDRARWPAKILDFLAAGRATVTNPVGEVARLFRKNEVGLLAEHEAGAFAEGIAELLRDPDRLRSMGARARRVMAEEWDWRARSKQIAEMVAG